HAITTAWTLSSPSACSIASTSPCRTAVDSAFTGGLFDSTISTSPCLRVEIGLVVGLSITSSMSALRRWALGCCSQLCKCARQRRSSLPELAQQLREPRHRGVELLAALDPVELDRAK